MVNHEKSEVGLVLLLLLMIFSAIFASWYFTTPAVRQLLFFALPLKVVPHQDFIPFLFGDKAVALFDLWSIDHFAWGVVVGAIIYGIGDQQRQTELLRFVLWMLILAYVWEGHETWMEIGGRGEAIAHWKDGIEHWSNRYLGDPGLFLLGGMLGRRLEWLHLPAFVYLCLWSLVNVFAPTCMWVQNKLLSFLASF